MDLRFKAILTLSATITLQVEDIRTSFLAQGPFQSVATMTLESRPPVLRIIVHSLSHPKAGVRYAACQCIRALSRSVSVLRTAIGDDTRIPDVLLKIVSDDGDKRVVLVALKCIANMVSSVI